MNGKYKQWLGADRDFFDMDEENKVIHMKLRYASPSDIFDTNAVTKVPLFDDDFSSWLSSAFEYVPKKYHLDLDVEFEDMQGYSEEELGEIFTKNIALEFKRSHRLNRSKDKLAWFLCGMGLVSLVIMIIIAALWQDGGIAHEVVLSVMDIAATVTLWEALGILLVESSERRSYLHSLKSRFGRISFTQKPR